MCTNLRRWWTWFAILDGIFYKRGKFLLITEQWVPAVSAWYNLEQWTRMKMMSSCRSTTYLFVDFFLHLTPSLSAVRNSCVCAIRLTMMMKSISGFVFSSFNVFLSAFLSASQTWLPIFTAHLLDVHLCLTDIKSDCQLLALKCFFLKRRLQCMFLGGGIASSFATSGYTVNSTCLP